MHKIIKVPKQFIGKETDIDCEGELINSERSIKCILKKQENENLEIKVRLIEYIDIPEKYYSEGLRVEGDVRASVYNNKILDFLVENYSPYKVIDGFFFWKNNNTKATKDISVKENLKKIMNDTPRNLCLKIDVIKTNCFIKIANKKNGIIIDVIYGNYDHKTIKEIINIENKLYFNKKNPFIEKFNNFDENFDNLEITLLSDNTNYLIKSNY